jgi:hypothetical protein
MNKRAENGPEAVFEIVWHQHNPDDWAAEILDCLTGERRRVYTLDELARFVQPHPHADRSPPLEPKSGR